MRIKNHWFKAGASRSPTEHAHAMAFIAWRVAKNMLERMRKAGFDVDAGPLYFAFMREVLVFLTQVLDRMAYQRMDADGRVAFTTALVRRLAAIVADNETDLLGPPGAGQPDPAERFVALVNALAQHYAEFGADPTVKGFAPDFAFLRYLGARLTPLLPPKDEAWVVDQVMSVEAPEAVATVRRGLEGLLSPEPRPARGAAMSGD